MSERPVDIVSALTDSMMAPRVPVADAVRAGRKALTSRRRTTASCFSSTTRSGNNANQRVVPDPFGMVK
jgi:hypothetical protein